VPLGRSGMSCPCGRLVVVLADCRMGEERSKPERLTRSSSDSCRCGKQVNALVLRFTADDAVALATDQVLVGP
jgi:hypothetical protein